MEGKAGGRAQDCSRTRSSSALAEGEWVSSEGSRRDLRCTEGPDSMMIKTVAQH